MGGRLREARPRGAERGFGRPGTSRRLAEGELSLPEGLGSVTEGLSDILGFEVGQFGDDLVGRHAVGHHGDDGGHRDSQASDAGLAAHFPGLEGDPLERHVLERTTGIRSGHSSTRSANPTRSKVKREPFGTPAQALEGGPPDVTPAVTSA